MEGRAKALAVAGVGAAAVYGVVKLMKKDVTGRNAKVCIVLGAQWGDEGKGKLVDVLAGGADVVARFNGGANAGHTLEVDGKTYAFHLCPCGILQKNCLNVIGNGVVLHLPTLFEELKSLDDDVLSRLVISDRAHVLLDSHREIDALLEAEKKAGKIGTTKRGIGPCYASKANRNGLRVCDLVDGTLKAKLKTLRDFQDRHYKGATKESELDALEEMTQRLVKAGSIRDTIVLMADLLKTKKKILAEGANACMLDLDFGTYPYVTSSSTTAGGVCTGLGIPPKHVECVIGVVKAYTTRVGGGPFPTELDLDSGAGLHLSSVGREYGTTTGRKRRCGWLDAPLLRYSHAINAYDSICLTKLDVLTGLPKLNIAVEYKIRGKPVPRVYMPASLEDLAAIDVTYVELDGWTDDITNCTSFRQLPKQAQAYIRAIEQYTDMKVSWVGVGPGRDSIFVMPGC